MTPHNNGSTMLLERFERDMLILVTRWAPFGGPPPDTVFTEFGLPAVDFDCRVRSIAWSVVRSRAHNTDRLLCIEVLRILGELPEHVQIPPADPSPSSTQLAKVRPRGSGGTCRATESSACDAQSSLDDARDGRHRAGYSAVLAVSPFAEQLSAIRFFR